MISLLNPSKMDGTSGYETRSYDAVPTVTPGNSITRFSPYFKNRNPPRPSIEAATMTTVPQYDFIYRHRPQHARPYRSASSALGADTFRLTIITGFNRLIMPFLSAAMLFVTEMFLLLRLNGIAKHDDKEN